MKSKIYLSIFIGMFLFLALASTTSAASVTTSLFYDSTTERTLSIYNGDSFDIVVSADSVFEDSMTIKVDLTDNSGDIITNILDLYTTSDSYFNTITVSKSAYSIPGNYKIKAKVIGASGQTATSELSLEVKAIPAINNPPMITSIPITSVNEGAYYSYQLIATDADADSLTYSLTQKPGWLSISSTGLISGTAPYQTADYEYSISVKVCDGKDSVYQTFKLKVINIPSPPQPPVNHAPVITSNPITSVNESTFYSYQVIATDADSDPLVYSFIQKPEWLSINSSGFISGTAPSVTSNTEYTITIKVSDGKDSVFQKFVLSVQNNPEPPVNHAPVITSNPITSVNELTFYSYQVVATDQDGDSLTYTLTQNPLGFSINSSGFISGTAPSVISNTEYTITIKVSDGKDYVSQSFTLNVLNKQEPPQDTIPPTVLILFPVNGTTYKTHQTILKFIANDSQSSITCKYSINNGAQVLTPCNQNITGLSSIEGTNVWKVFVVDSAGNSANASVIFKVKIYKDSDDDDEEKQENDKKRIIQLTNFQEFNKTSEEKSPLVIDTGKTVSKKSSLNLDNLLFWLICLILITLILMVIVLIVKKVN